MTNTRLEHLIATRERVRKDINKLMKSHDYYTNSSKYDKVRGLTGLETYITSCIEDIERRIAKLDDDYYM